MQQEKNKNEDLGGEKRKREKEKGRKLIKKGKKALKCIFLGNITNYRLARRNFICREKNELTGGVGGGDDRNAQYISLERYIPICR